MRIDLLYPELPPTHDAIGEHNRELAAELARQGVAVGLIHASARVPEPVDGVELICLPGKMPTALKALPSLVAARQPDWLITAYNPFSYGSRGVTLELPVVLRRVRKNVAGTRLALYAHETLVPCRTPRLLVLSQLQRFNLLALARCHDLVLMSTEPWADRFSRWWPTVPTTHIPIGSNLPTSELSREAARRRLGLGPSALVMAVFGGLNQDRDLSLVSTALRQSADGETTLLYVGADGKAAEQAAEQAGIRIVNRGRAERQVAADALAAADIGLALFVGGVSARRGSFLALLQHGVPTVTTRGPLTGPALSAAAIDGCFELCAATPDGVAISVSRLVDRELRADMGPRGRRYYEQRHAWPHLAAEYISLLFDGVPAKDAYAGPS